VVGNLINPQLKPGFVANVRADYAKLRAQHGERKGNALLSLEEARQRRTAIEWKGSDIVQPEFTGRRVLSSESDLASKPGSSFITIEQLVPFIDWSPFFHTWELRGRYPAILENAEARKLFDDAEALLKKIVSEKLLKARAVYGLYPANSVGDDVELYTDASREAILTKFHFLRQQMEKPREQFNHCLADYIAPREAASGGARVTLPDHLGAFAVTAGFGVEELCAKFEADHDDYNSIMVKALADRLAEAFAEFLHKRVREEWGYGKCEQLSTDDLIREKYRGIRPAAGYPACPDHTEKGTLWKLLDVEGNTGIRLTESYAMWPGASVSGLYFAHPDARYFAVGKLGRDQAVDYAARKGMPVQEVERWLGPYLEYEPSENSSEPDESKAIKPALTL
jgi:5-methyltetrahydrofolate--homocysteine methyltransferase